MEIMTLVSFTHSSIVLGFFEESVPAMPRCDIILGAVWNLTIDTKVRGRESGVSISKFLLCGRVAANKTLPYFDCGSVAAEAENMGLCLYMYRQSPVKHQPENIKSCNFYILTKVPQCMWTT